MRNNKEIYFNGVKYKSIDDFCNNYNISRRHYYNGLNKGYSLEEIIIKKCKPIQIQDHLGNNFNSIREMCKFYDIPVTTYRNRIDSGKTIEESLTKSNIVVDYEGKVYKSIYEMCAAHEVSKSYFQKQKNLGKSLFECLNKTAEYKIVDENNNKFKTIKEFSIFYNLDYGKCLNNFKKELSINELISKSKKMSKYECYDHIGNRFSSVSEMCRFYNISNNTYNRRLRDGMSLEKILTTPLNDYSVKDHKGNNFKSMRAMAEYYGLTPSKLNSRLKNGWPLKLALTLKDDIYYDGSSFPEKIVRYYIQQYVPAYKNKFNGVEADVFLPTQNLVIEYDGWYWHKNSNKHDNKKDKLFDKLGFKVIRIRENPLKEDKKCYKTFLINRKNNVELLDIILKILKILKIKNVPKNFINIERDTKFIIDNETDKNAALYKQSLRCLQRKKKMSVDEFKSRFPVIYDWIIEFFKEIDTSLTNNYLKNKLLKFTLVMEILKNNKIKIEYLKQI